MFIYIGFLVLIFAVPVFADPLTMDDAWQEAELILEYYFMYILTLLITLVAISLIFVVMHYIYEAIDSRRNGNRLI